MPSPVMLLGPPAVGSAFCMTPLGFPEPSPAGPAVVDRPSRASSSPLNRWEWLAVAALAVFWLVLRAWTIGTHLWDSDETQHLHVAWEWTRGRLPYRDFFDNHTPLLHLLFAPLVGLLGERANLVGIVRWCMLPLVALTHLCTYQIGKQVFSPRVGILAALLCAFYPDFFFKAVEFRTDVLWMACWAAALVALTVRRPTVRTRFTAGLLLGAAFASSQKTAMLVLVLLLAATLTALATRLSAPSGEPRGDAPGAWRVHWPGVSPAFWAGVVLVPGSLLAWFTAHGAFPQVFYCLVSHNLSIIPSEHRPPVWADGHALRFWLFLPGFAAAAAVCRASRDAERARRQAFVVCVGASYCTVLLGLWTVVSAQDYLPYYPVWTVTIAAGLLWVADRLGVVSRVNVHRRWAAALVAGAVPACAVATPAVWLVKDIHFSDRRNRFKEEQIREVLQVTRPDEPVLDAKGGSIFRPRAIPYVMETITRWQMREGRLPDDIPARLAATRTTVAMNLPYFPANTRLFIERNYLSIGLIRVAGQRLRLDGSKAASLEVAIPARYVVADVAGPMPGLWEDGIPGTVAGRDLAPGHHRFVCSRPPIGEVYLLTQGAYERGFTPFNPELAAFGRHQKVAN